MLRQHHLPARNNGCHYREAFTRTIANWSPSYRKRDSAASKEYQPKYQNSIWWTLL